MHCAAGALQVEISNSIDHCCEPSVPSEPDLSREGGLGLYLIRKLVDEVDLRWDSDTATIKMVKRLSQVI